MDEAWCDVPGLIGFRASTLGRIQSRWVKGKSRGRGAWPATLGDSWVDVKTFNSKGYLRFVIPGACSGGKQAKMSVHQAVCRAFFGTPLPGQEVCHDDGNKSNNRSSNLKWGTPKENQLDMTRHGTRASRAGEKNGSAKLTAGQVYEIRNRINEGESKTAIASDFKVSACIISMIGLRKKWKHLPEIRERVTRTIN